MSRGDARNQAQVLLQAPASGEPVSWTFEGSGRVLGYTPGMSVWSSPALGLVDGRAVLIAGSYDRNVYCLDAASGAQLWRYTTGDGIYAAPTLWRDGEQVVAFVSSSDRLVYALDAASGSRKWIHSLQAFRPTLGGARLSSPVVGRVSQRDAVFVGYWVWDRSLAKSLQEGGVIALDARTGQQLWRRALGDNAVTAPTYGQVDDRGALFVGSSNGNLYALEADNGQERWHRTELDSILGAPALVDFDATQLVVTASKYGMLRALEAADGRELWSYKVGDRVTGAPLVARATTRWLVIAGSFDRTMYALDLADGRPVWRYRTAGAIYASAALADDGVVITSWDHHLHGVWLEDGAPRWLAFTGRPLWDTLGLGDSTWASPAAARINGVWMTYVGSYSGVLYGLPLSKIPVGNDDATRSNWLFWLSLPLAFVAVAAFSRWLTLRARRRGQ